MQSLVKELSWVPSDSRGIVLGTVLLSRNKRKC